MEISNFADLHDAVREPIVSSKAWNLCAEAGRVASVCGAGVRTVYTRFYSSAGGTSYGIFSTRIYYGIPPPGYTPSSGTTGQTPSTGGSVGETLLDNIYDFFGNLIPGFFEPAPVATEEVSLERVVPKETPLAMRSGWLLLPGEQIRMFVFAPLSKDIAFLGNKFPAIRDTFKSVGIARQTDAEKLIGITLRIPGLAESVLPEGDVTIARAGSVPNIPVVALSATLKQELPSEILFVRTSGEKIDLPTFAKVNSEGITEQRVSTLTGTILKLVIRPEYPAKQVLGYLTFKSRAQGRELGMMQIPTEGDLSPGAERPSLFASMFASIGQIAQKAVTQAPEERFVVREFAYTDPEGDGIYTATIEAPVVSGQYDIHTIIDYVDPRYANKDIKLTTLIDPEGYVYESIRGKELRIPGAIVSMRWLNPATNQYELWPSEKFNQENPQVTDVRGTYAFLVPPGHYALQVSAPGYGEYTGKPFEVTTEGSGVHVNIELVGGSTWADIFDWKTDLLILISLLLAYNFYVDRKREWMLHGH
jgi:hypothetical protein